MQKGNSMRRYKIPSEGAEGFDVKMFARSIGSHFFDRDTMEYFGSKLEEYSVFSDGEHGAFFVTSEQLTSEVKNRIMGTMIKPADDLLRVVTGADIDRNMEGMDSDNPRQWKIRYASYKNRAVSTYGSLLFSSLLPAEEEAKRLARIKRGYPYCMN